MSGPFDPDDIPDEVLWELSDPDLDYDRVFEDCVANNIESPWEDDILDGNNVLNGRRINKSDSGAEVVSPVIPKTKTKKKSAYKSYFCVNKDEIPTKCLSEYWIHAYGKKMFNYTLRTGKWLIFCPKEHINEAWEQVKDATERDLLGGHSKVSTLKGQKSKEYVICVFTSDWKDEKDVMRVREVLRELGFEKPLPYKTDSDTLAGKYACKGDKKISKYWE